MSKSRKKKPMVYEKPRLISLCSNDVAVGMYCIAGPDWSETCADGGNWEPACNPGGTWPGCNDGGAWPGCVEGGSWTSCIEGYENLYDCASGVGFVTEFCFEGGDHTAP